MQRSEREGERGETTSSEAPFRIASSAKTPTPTATDTDRERPSRAWLCLMQYHFIGPFSLRSYCRARALPISDRFSPMFHLRLRRRDRSRPRETCPPRFLLFAVIARRRRRLKRADSAVESPSWHFSRVLHEARRLTLDALSLRGVVVRVRARDLYGPQFREIALDVVGLTTVGRSCPYLPFTRSS